MRITAILVALSLPLSCAPRPPASPDAGSDWEDVTAPLDPRTTPVYEGDAPLSFEFLKDMRTGDPLTLSAYSLGAHSGTHIDAPMHFIRDGGSIDRVPL